MHRVTRTILAAVCGCAFGAVFGPITVLIPVLSDVLVRGWPWPEMDADDLRAAAIASILAGFNCCLGAALVAGWGVRGPLGISILPVSLHIIAAIWALIADPRDFLLFQLAALMFAVVVWIAGRLGQLIGRVFQSRDPQPVTVPDP